MNFPIRIIAAIVAGGVASVAHAEGFVTTQPGGPGLLRLDLSGVGAATLGTSGLASVDLGLFTVTNTGAGVLVGETAAALGGNGSWQAPAPWATAPLGPAAGAFVSGLSYADNAVTFTLDPGLTTGFVGLRLMTDTSAPPPGDLTLSVFNAAGTLIATSALLSPVSGGGINESAFIGYESDAGVIGSFRVAGAYHVYGDISYAQPVPEPGELAFMMVGLAGAAALARRRRAARPA